MTSVIFFTLINIICFQTTATASLNDIDKVGT